MSVGTGRGVVTDSTLLVIVRGAQTHRRKAKWHARQKDGRLYCGRLELSVGEDGEAFAGDFLEMWEVGAACPMCAATLERRMREGR